MPGVVVVEDCGGVKGPAGFSGLRGGVGPAVADDLVDADEEVEVGFGFHVEGRGAEDGGVEPCEGFGGGDVVAEEMVGGGGPAECGKLSPTWAFAFREGHEALA
jgi:hypothetical protein